MPLLLISLGALSTSCALVAVASQAASSSSPSSSSSKALIGDQQLVAQARAGGLDPADYIDEAGELEVMANQQHIPTAQLMAAAGHLVPDNFFLPGSSIPTAHYMQQLAIHQRYLQAQQQAQQQQQQQQQHQEQLHQAASQQQARIVAAPARYAAGSQRAPPLELLMAAAAEHHSQQQQQHQSQSHQPEAQQQQQGQLIDFNGYQLTAQPDARDAGAQMDLVDFLAAPATLSQAQLAAALYEQQLHAHQQQQQQQQQQQVGDQLDHMTALASSQQHEQAADASGDQQQQQHYQLAGQSIGPDYQLIDQFQAASGQAAYEKEHQQQQQQHQQQHQQQQRPFGLPTKSSSREPPGMLKPLGNPKTISSPAIDFVANSVPKGSAMQALADKLPAQQTPTVFSFASSKDPSEKVKAVNQKKRTVMRQAEQMAKLLIKSINDKFGTTLGDQTDIPFLLSSLGPLGMAQNLLLDPTLLVTLLNSAEKTYFSDVLPGPAKNAIRPVLNLFRVPNKKRDKANLLNILSYLASGGQTGSSVPSKHRQSFGIEKSSSFSSSANSNNNKATTKSGTSTKDSRR